MKVKLNEMQKFLLLFLFIFSVITAVLFFSKRINQKEYIIQQVDVNEEQKMVTKIDVYNFIIAMNIEHPEIVMSQVILESGHLKSEHFNIKNNMFGMNVAKQRPTVSLNDSGVANYDNWKMSIIDYALWQCSYAKNLSEEKYYERLKIYSKDENYINKIKEIKKNLQKLIYE